MECSNCKLFYNDNDHCPRLLISCGHSICEKCLKELFHDSSIVCPECQTINKGSNISSFPRNLALVQIKPEKNKTKHTNINESTLEMNKDPNFTCNKHGKRIDAFCERDRMLVCIVCILEDGHKSHDLNSIQNAAQKEKALVQKANELTKIVESKLINLQKEIKDGQHNLATHAEKSRIEITQFFNDIRKALAERETLLKQNISELLRKHENILRMHDEKIGNHLKNITLFYQEFDKAINDTDIKLLSGSLTRMDVIKKATSAIDTIDFTIPFSELNKENELNTIWKTLYPSKPIPIITVTNGNKYGKSTTSPNLNILKPNKFNNRECPQKLANLHGNNMAKPKCIPIKKDNNQFIPTLSLQNHNFGFNLSMGDKNNNKILNNIPQKENINHKSDIRKITSILPNDGSGNTGSNNTNNSGERKINSPLKNTLIKQGQILYYDPKPMLPVSLNFNNSDDLSEDDQHHNHNHNHIALSTSQERIENHLNRSNSMNSTPKRIHFDRNMQSSHNQNLSNPDNGSKTPNNIFIHNRRLAENNNSRNESLNNTNNCYGGTVSGIGNIGNSSGSAYRYNRNQQYLSDKIDSIDNKRDALIIMNEGMKDSYVDNEGYTNRDSSNNTDGEILDILNSEQQQYNNNNITQTSSLTRFQGNKIDNKNIYRLDNTTISKNGNNNNNNCNGSLQQGHNKDFKNFLYDNDTRHYLDSIDITQQKLDLSMICQQITSYIYVIGGFIDNGSCTIEKYDLQKGKWDVAGSLLKNRTKFTAIALPNLNILILGGKQDGSRISNCEEFNVKDGTSKVSDIALTSAKSGFGCLLINDNIYVCGGNDGHNILRTFECFNLKSKKWCNLPSLKYKRDELAIAIGSDHKIYAIGGFGGPNNTCLSSVERYDPQAGVWESIANLNVPRRALAAVTLPDGIYAIGGFDGENYLSTVERYDDSSNEWIFVSSMNYARCTLSAISTGDCHNIYVFGGFDNGPLNSVEKYSVINDSWDVICPMQFKRFMHASVLTSK